MEPRRQKLLPEYLYRGGHADILRARLALVHPGTTVPGRRPASGGHHIRDLELHTEFTFILIFQQFIESVLCADT